MALQAGQKAPDFTLLSNTGEEFTLSVAVREKPVALVFFPLAFSGICQGELCQLRDNIELFKNAGVQLAGVSVDSNWALRVWGEAQGYDFPLLSDFWPHGQVASQFAAFNPERGIANRASFIITADMQIVWSTQNEPGQARPLAEYRNALEKLAGA